MYNVSNNIKNALKSNAVTTTARITVLPSNTVIDGNNLVSIKITDKCYTDGVFIGTAMAKETDIEIINDNYDLADKEFELEVGVLVENGTYEYIPYGNFIVKEYKNLVSSNHYNIIAYDYMDKLNPTFIDEYDYENPITLKQFYQRFATFYGIQIENQTLPNEDFLINEKPYFEGMSGRTVLSRMAEMFGGFAKFNRDNKLQIITQTQTIERLSRNEMNSSLERDNMFGPINVVSLRYSQVEGENVTLRDEESIAQFGENTIQIYDNPFVYSQDLRELAINDLFDHLKGLYYYPTKFNYKLIYFDCGDVVEVQDMKTDNYYPTMILNQVLQIPNTRQSKCENLALTKMGLEHQFIPTEKRLNARTEFLVDKANQEIILINQEVNNTNERMAEQKITVDTISNTVSETVTKLNNDYLTAEQTQGQIDSINDNYEILSERTANLELSSSQLELDITKIETEGVTKVTTTTGFTFNENGLSIDKTDAVTGTIIDEAALHVKEKAGETDILYAGYVKEDNIEYNKYIGQTIVASANMIIKNYLVVPRCKI